MEKQFLERLHAAFPDFAAKLGDGKQFELEHVQPPAGKPKSRS